MQQRIAVVVPAFQEERLVARTLARVPDGVGIVVVVDDASTDGTAEAALALRDPRVDVVRHTENRGVGAAIATGYRRAFELGADVAVVMAGDAQMDPEDLPALLAPVLRDEADYVKGDRLSWPGVSAQMPFLRFVGNHVLSLCTRVATGLDVRDSQCGYTAITRNAWATLDLRRMWPRYGYPNDLLGRLAAAKLRVRDVPVRPVYADEVSKLGVRHALVVIPFVIARVFARRVARIGVGRRVAALPQAVDERA